MAAVVAMAVVLAGALGAGSYLIFKPKAEIQVKAAEQPTAAAVQPNTPSDTVTPAPAPKDDPAPASIPGVADTKADTASKEASAADSPKESVPPPAAAIAKQVSNKARQNAGESRKQTDGNPSPGLAAAINASLDEGSQCMNRKKYDCAIGNANTVLRLDPANAPALDMKHKAKEAQERALSQIEIQ
jgi:hypothetical protein